MMTKPVQFRKMTRDEMAYRNLINLRYEPVSFTWLDREWKFELSPCRKGREERFHIEADWGGAQIVMRADSVWMEQVAQGILKMETIAELPEPVMLAMLETAFAETSTQIERVTRKRFRITEAGTEHSDMAQLTGFEWEAKTEDQTICGELWVDALGLSFLAAALQKANIAQAGPGEWLKLPVPVRFMVGWVDLPMRTLANTVSRDVIMLDESWLQDDDSFIVKVGRTSGFRAEISGSTITVTESLEEIMADQDESEYEDDDEYEADDEGDEDEDDDDDDDDEEEDDDEDDEDSEGDYEDDEGDEGDDEGGSNETGKSRQTLNDVTVRLTFDLGERVLTLGELKSLAPGYTFDLGRDLRHTVTIRANGLAIGDGELVEIEGRIGVSILNIKRKKQWHEPKAEPSGGGAHQEHPEHQESHEHQGTGAQENDDVFVEVITEKA